MSFKVDDRVTISDRSMKSHGFSGIITGIESDTDNPVYNVQVELMYLDKKLSKLKKTGSKRNINLLESQLTKEYIEPEKKTKKKTRKKKNV